MSQTWSAWTSPHPTGGIVWSLNMAARFILICARLELPSPSINRVCEAGGVSTSNFGRSWGLSSNRHVSNFGLWPPPRSNFGPILGPAPHRDCIHIRVLTKTQITYTVSKLKRPCFRHNAQSRPAQATHADGAAGSPCALIESSHAPPAQP